MKKVFFLLCMTVLSSCSVLQATEWDWLDQPESIRWVDVLVDGWHYSISYQVPARHEHWGYDFLATPTHPEGVDTVTFEAPPFRFMGSWMIARYNWDTWWGGYFKESGHDFHMEIRRTLYEEDEGFLEMPPEGWLEWLEDEDEWYYEADENKDEERRARYLANLIREVRSNAKSQQFVFYHDPIGADESIIYFTPVADDELLSFWFRVSKFRFGHMEDPEWNQRRWEIIQQIVDSIEVTPKPPNF